MARRIATWMLLTGMLAGVMTLIFWPGSGLIHSGPVPLIGTALLTGALMKFARPRSVAHAGARR